MSIITWLADHLFAARRRAAEVRREITEHDASAAQIQTDLVRWTSDHARKVETDMRRTKNEVAGRGHLYSGAMRNGLEHVMETAQEAWRNAASEKLRAFKGLARAEGDDHARRRGGAGPTLVLSEDLRSAVDSWRERPYPVPDTGESPLRPRDLIREDEEVAPLLTPEGLTWEAAGRPTSEGRQVARGTA
jgi:hypothetical protein